MNNGLHCLIQHQPTKVNWNKGSKILYLRSDEFGEKGGMVSEIAERILNKFISIRHYGLIKNGVKTTEAPEVEKWANGLENYTFEENNGVTLVIVNLDTTPDFIGYMSQTYPKALEKLKENCEK